MPLFPIVSFLVLTGLCVFVTPRGCTDVFCCILFILFLFGYFAVGILGSSLPLNRHMTSPSLISASCPSIRATSHPIDSHMVWLCPPCSVVPGRPQEGDLPNGQPRAVLWTGWNSTGVSSPLCWSVAYMRPETPTGQLVHFSWLLLFDPSSNSLGAESVAAAPQCCRAITQVLLCIVFEWYCYSNEMKVWIYF